MVGGGGGNFFSGCTVGETLFNERGEDLESDERQLYQNAKGHTVHLP